MKGRISVLVGGIAIALWLVAGGCGCEDEPAPAPPPITPERPPVPPLLGARRVATDGAFDLVATPDGALFSWGPPLAEGAGVRVVAVSRLGSLSGAERDVARGSVANAAAADEGARPVIELVAISAGPALGVAWVVGGIDDLVAEGTVSAGGLEGFGPPFSLGDGGHPTVPSARGRLLGLAGSGDALRAHVRIPPRACDGGESCAAAVRRRLDEPSGRGGGDRPMESVPDACEPFLVGGVETQGTLFHALCVETEAGPTAILYAIDPEPMHAAAVEPLPGCEPIGLAPTETGAALVASCPEGIAVGWVDGLGRLEGAARPAERAVACAAGRPTAVVGGEGGRLELPLTSPLSRIEALLPETIAGPRARAVWTGEAILVAEPRDGEVWLERWQCAASGGPITRTDPL